MVNFWKHILMVIVVISVTANAGYAQDKKKAANTQTGQKTEKLTPQQHRSQLMHYRLDDEGDTVFVDMLQAARIYDKLPRQKGNEWRRFYKLVYNFNKVYPYALVARKLVERADSTIEADNLKNNKKDKFITEIQHELFSAFEGQMRNFNISQAALLIRLINREVGKSSYLIIKDYKNGAAAGFWQGVAKICGTSLKNSYDPENADQETEELVEMWENGEFDGLYYSLFGEFPTRPDIPSKYL